MGWYRDRMFPRIMDGAMGRARYAPIRDRVCRPLTGVVLEIGFGSGRNLPHLPPAVTALLAVDPMEAGRRLAAERLQASTVPVEFVGLDGAAVALPDGSVDSVLSTWSLCRIPDPVLAVGEIVRLLRPGGALRFVEHGRSPDARTARWQHRMNPIQRRIACGCHLDRDIPEILAAGGLEVTDLDTFYVDGEANILGWTFEGTARVT